MIMTTTMYEKESLELKDVRQMLHNNELKKKIDSTKKVLGLVVKKQRRRSQSREPKKGTEASSEYTVAITANSQGT